MTAELVPLPPPPGFGGAPAAAADRQESTVGHQALPPAATVAVATAGAAATAGASPPPAEWKPAGSKQATNTKQATSTKKEKRSKSPAPAAAAVAATAATPQPAPGAPTWEAPPPLPPDGGAAEPGTPKDPGAWSYDVDKTGIAIGFDQTLESDSVRKSWAEKGGSLSGYEAGLGMSFLALNESATGMTMTMSGVGFQGSFGLTSYSMTPPDYETRGTKWTAWKMGAGMNFSKFDVTTELWNSYTGTTTMNSSMTSLGITGCIGFLTATGSFDSETEWSGFAIGADWAPSIIKTTSTVDGVSTSGDAKLNIAGFALNFESGSMKTMAESMAKEAHYRLQIFILPPVVEHMPMFLSINVGSTWY